MDDPVAEFLAREDGALDDDIDIGGGVQQAVPAQVENGAPPVFQNGIGIRHGEGADSGVDLAAGQDNSDDMPSAPLSNGHGHAPSLNSISSSSNLREEHETIKKWREEHAKLLKEKDEAEIKQKQAMHDSAVAELKAWKEKRKAEIVERKKKNREIEKQLQKEEKSAAKSDGWSEVANLVDSVSPKSAPKNAPDTSRMRALIMERKAVA